MKQKLLKCLGKAIPMLIITMLLGSAAFAQKNVSGKVTGPDGKAVGGATVSVKGTAVLLHHQPMVLISLQYLLEELH